MPVATETKETSLDILTIVGNSMDIPSKQQQLAIASSTAASMELDSSPSSLSVVPGAGLVDVSSVEDDSLISEADALALDEQSMELTPLSPVSPVSVTSANGVNTPTPMEDAASAGTSSQVSSSTCPAGMPSASHHPHPTVIIFDWDDTLLASSFLASKGHRLDTDTPLSDDVKQHLEQLDAAVSSILQAAMQYGEVHVVTNAETGWVQLSAQKWLPGVVPLLAKLNIISARSTFEEKFPGSPFKWKFHAMQGALQGIHGRVMEHEDEHNGKHVHVISLGDSHVEREAARAVTSELKRIRTKTIKFPEHPTAEQLRRQLELVSNSLQYICSHDGDLDLMLTICFM